MNNDPTQDLRTALEKLGAREFEHVALSMDPHRGLAAIAYAQQRGVDHPISYAIKIFDNPDWQPASAKKPLHTNQHVEKACPHCGGHRFVLVSDEPELYGETYAPCRECNAKSNTTRWLIDGTRLETAPR